MKELKFIVTVKKELKKNWDPGKIPTHSDTLYILENKVVVYEYNPSSNFKEQAAINIIKWYLKYDLDAYEVEHVNFDIKLV